MQSQTDLKFQANNFCRQFYIQIKANFQNKLFQNVIQQLNQISSLQDQLIANSCRRNALKVFQQHLNNPKHCITQSEGNILETDADCLLDIISLMMDASLEEGVDCEVLNNIILKLIADDPRYTFIMYRSKILNFDKNPNVQIGHFQKMKYLRSISLFMPFIMKASQGVYADFVSMIEEARIIFETELNQSMSESEENEETGKLNEKISSVFVNFCIRILDECCLLMQQQDNGQLKSRGYQIIEQSISVLLFTQTIQKNVAHQFLSFVQAAQKFISLHKNFLSPQNMKLYPCTIHIIIVKFNKLSSLLSPQSLLYSFSKILLKIGPSSTIHSQAGGAGDLVDFLVKQTIEKSCRLLLGDAIKVENQKVWLSQNVFVDLLQFYKMISVYCGFIGEASKQISQLIHSVLKLSSIRYKNCPILPIKIWNYLLQQSDENETDYRIFCIGQYRKHLIANKDSIIQKCFQNHEYHNHSQIFYLSSSQINHQLQIVAKMGIDRVHCQYIGHIISFIAVWLILVRLYTTKFDNYHNHKLKEVRELIQLNGKSMHDILKKKLESINEEDKKSEVQLVLFRYEELDFN